VKKIVIAVATMAVILTVLYKVNNYTECESVMEHIFKVAEQTPARQYESEMTAFQELSADYFAYESFTLGYAKICHQLGALDYADYSDRFFSVNKKVREKAMANLAEFGGIRNELSIDQIRVNFEDSLKKTGMDRVEFCKININKKIHICPKYCDFSILFPDYTEIIMKDFNTLK
jgi:hypothetical protein